MELRQRPELRQKVTLSPQVYQGLSMLAMPITDLRVLVDAELLENPVLEAEEESPDDERGDAEESSSGAEEDAAWDDWLQMYEDLEASEPLVPREPDPEQVDTEQFVGGIQTFEEYLYAQIGMMDLPSGVAKAARAVVGTLDDDGFFIGDCAEIAAVAGVAPAEAEAGLAAVQQLDPPGVGARSLVEALRIQMIHLGLDEPMLVAIAERHLPEVASRRHRTIAKALGINEQEVERLAGLLRMLNPRPAGAFSPGPSPGYIVPDVTVRRVGEDWLVFSDTEVIPTLRVSPQYRSMLRSDSRVDDTTKRYLRDKVRSAQSFIRNLDRRKDTISRITSIILEVQAEFFEDGKGPLRPLRLEDVAAEVGVHLSTVSRGVSGKYMSTPYGLFELRHFFSGGYRTVTGTDVAATTVRSRLKELVASEDPGEPLSDQQIAERLSDEGVRIARRTVAKYRDELRIEPSWQRRRR